MTNTNEFQVYGRMFASVSLEDKTPEYIIEDALEDVHISLDHIGMGQYGRLIPVSIRISI